MASLKDVLKELNKNRMEVDQFKTADQYPYDYFTTKILSTTSPYLDYKIKAELGKGGIPRGRFTLIAGGEGSSKSSLALLAATSVQKEGQVVVYFDAEATTDESYFSRFGIDKRLFIHYKGNNLEEMLDAAEAFSKADEVGMIVIDSLPAFTSKVVEDKSAEDNSIGVEAKKFNARMPIIYGNIARRGIALIAINFYKLNPGAMGDPRVLSRGEWQKYMSSLTLELTKKDLIKDKDKNPIGHKMDVRIKKSKMQEYDPKSEFTLNFYYGYGFNRADEYADLFIETGVIRQAGAWFFPPTKDDNELKFQGRDSLVQFLKDNEEYLNNLIESYGSF